MIFSFPTFLPWIAAAFLPWILHLFLFRKAETLRFPSLYFLKQCYGWSNRLKWQRLLLLLTRSALMLYFILGLLGPSFERAAVPSGSAVNGSILFVLDDRPAMKMNVMAKSESFFEKYRQALIEELEHRPHTQEVAAVPLSDLAVPASIRFDSPRTAIAKIRTAAVYSLAVPAEEYLRTSSERLRCTVLFFSPFRLDIKDPKILRVGPNSAPQPNVTMLSLKSPTGALAGQPVPLEAALVDPYGRPADAMVRFQLDTQELAVVPAERGHAAFVMTGAAEGRHLITAEILQSAPDGYPDDDARTAQIVITSDRKVGVASGTLPKAFQAALQAFDPSFSPSEDDASASGRSTIVLRSEKQWDQIRRVILIDAPDVAPPVIRKTLARGADIVIFSDAWESRTVQWPYSFQMSMTGDASVVSLDASTLFQIAGAPDGYSDYSSSATPNRYLNVVRKLKLTPRPGDVVLASFTDGLPAIVRRPVDHGSITFVAFSIDDPFFQSNPAYLLFAQKLITLSEPQSPAVPANSREPLFAAIPLRSGAGIPLGSAAPAGPVRLTQGSVSAVLSLGYTGGSFFAELPSPAPSAGLYHLLVADEERGLVFLHPAPPPQVALAADADSGRQRFEMESFFFWIAILLMAVELLLLRQMRSPSYAS